MARATCGSRMTWATCTSRHSAPSIRTVQARLRRRGSNRILRKRTLIEIFVRGWWCVSCPVLLFSQPRADLCPSVLQICGHRPMYCSDTFASSSSRPGAGEQRNLEPLLLKYNVDLMIAGHHHVYERTPPVHNGTVTGSGSVYTDPVDPVHITIGTGGAHYPEAWLPDQPAWSAARAIDYGFGLLTAWNATHLSYSFEPLTNETAADEMWIVRSNAPQ